jgi:MOSC domain-containing protein YiiM
VSRDVPRVVSVSVSARHGFSKTPTEWIRLVEGLGVEGDAHAGVTVQHLSRVCRDPTQPNLRQVHLVHAELHDELELLGHHVVPGDIGENITTRGIDLLALPRGTRLRLGQSAVIEITGLRNPCVQVDRFQPGLMQATLDRDHAGEPVRKAGVMAVVMTGGVVGSGDPIEVELSVRPKSRLDPV